MMSFSEEIVRWYEAHKRDLPWRQTQDAYVIWLSEVILQQTRVAQGLPYFERFVAHYPDVHAFAAASEGEILRHWQGLGYYSRARNMHKAAKLVVSEMGGVFPTSYDQLLRLPGVGEYTAAAISSLASGEARAVVDGNVFRVLARYFGIDTPINSSAGKTVFQQMADSLLDRANAGKHNQAFMEFGAMLCRPKNPDCARCPVSQGCEALRSGRVSELPIKLKNKPSTNRYFNYFLIQEADHAGLYLQQRGGGDIWENLYQLPLLETPEPLSPAELNAHPALTEWFGDAPVLVPIGGVVKHVLSHQNLHARFFEVRHASVSPGKKEGWDYVLLKELNKLAKPKLIYAFLTSYLNDNQP